jgi:hypothetical protein
MWQKGWKSTLFTLVLALTMVWTPAFAAEVVEPAPGSGPEIPLGLTEEWTELAPNTKSWHAFYFSSPHAMRAGEEVEEGTVTVRMEFTPKEAGRFEMLSQEDVDLWAKGEKYTPVGEGCISCGCELADNPRKLSWTGVPAEHGLNYILVCNPTDKPLYYRLFIDENQFVSYPTPIVTPGTAAVVAVVPAEAPAAAVAAPTTVPAVGEWFTLQPGDETWFNFAYDANTGIKHDKDPQSIYFTLFVKDKQPLCDVAFEVFTDAEYQQLIKNGEDNLGENALKGTAVGCGTDNDTMRGDLTWTGQFHSSQIIHVRVHLGTIYGEGRNVMFEAEGKTIEAL